MTEAPSEGQTPKGRRRLSFGLVGNATAVVTLIAAVVSLVFVFKPGFQPKPPPDKASAAITKLEIEPDVTFREYLVEKNSSLGAITPALLRRTGVLLTVQWTASGLAGKDLPLRWELIDATRGSEALQEQAITIRPARNDEQDGLLLWAPVPRNGHRYRVKVTIYQPGQRTPIVFFDRAGGAFTAPAGR